MADEVVNLVAQRLQDSINMSQSGGGEWHQLAYRAQDAVHEIERLRTTINAMLKAGEKGDG